MCTDHASGAQAITNRQPAGLGVPQQFLKDSRRPLGVKCNRPAANPVAGGVASQAAISAGGPFGGALLHGTVHELRSERAYKAACEHA